MKSISVLIKPSSSMCNMNCKYCFYRDVQSYQKNTSKTFMKSDVVEEIINKTFETKASVITYFFQGGEPTLIGLDFYKDFIQRVNNRKKNEKIYYAIQTNASLINDDWALFFKNNNFLVGVSLDGIKEIHNALRGENYNSILNKIKLLNKYQVEYNVLIVVTKFIAKHYQKVYNNLKKEGFKYLQFIPCLDNFDKKSHDYSLTVKDYGDFLVGLYKLWIKDYQKKEYISIRLFDNIIKRLNGERVELCSFQGKCSIQFVIEADGTVYPCDFYCIDEYALGNIKEMSLNALFKSDNAIKFLKEGSSIKNKCLDCKYYTLCMGGCRRENEKEDFCESYKRLFEEII